MTPEAERLHTALIAAYPEWVRSRLDQHGIVAPATMPSAIETGRRALARRLEVLLSREPSLQTETPLELFRAALSAPTEALALAGVAPVARDAAQRAALPDDAYDLAPGSSEELGEDVWAAHLAWGVAKAEAVAGMVPARPTPTGGGERPQAVLVSTDLMDRSKLQSVAEDAGFELVVARNPAAVADAVERRPLIAFVDVTHPAADDAIRSLSSVTRRTIAFGPHIDDVALIRAKTLGAADAVPRSRFFSKLRAWFPTVV